MQSQFQKAIDLIKKTGDKLIIFDSAKPDNGYVIMGVKDYENLVLGKSEVRGLTENELLDKINRDIAVWKSEREFKENLAQYRQADKFDFFNDGKVENNEDKFGEENQKNKGNLWSIPKNIKEAADEVIEEDRQYLEDVEF